MSEGESKQEGLPWFGYLLLFSCIIIWGINSVAFKVATKPPYGFDPVFLHGIRFLIVAPCFAMGIALTNPKIMVLKREEILQYAGLGFLAIPIGETLQTFAVRDTTVANLTLLSHGTISIFTAFWAFVFLKQHLPKLAWLGAAVALVGVGIVAANGATGLHVTNTSLLGDGIAVLRSVIHGGYLLILSRWMRGRSAIQTTLYNATFGALWLLPYVLWKAPTFHWELVPKEAWWALFWTIVPTTLYAFLAWNWAMKRVGALVATNLFYLMPIAASIAAWLLLDEAMRPWQFVGAAVIVCGIVLLRWEDIRTLLEARQR